MERFEYDGVIELVMHEGCYGGVDLYKTEGTYGDESLTEALYEHIGVGDGVVGDWYPTRRFKAKITVEVLSEVQTEGEDF